MSNETKRDVFETSADKCAGYDAQASGGNVGHQDANLFMAEYEKALPDDLPVIPEAVGEILQLRGQTNLLVVLDAAKNGYKVSETLAWIIAYQNTFARAWVLGAWRVQETGEIVKLEVK